MKLTKSVVISENLLVLLLGYLISFKGRLAYNKKCDEITKL